MEINTSSIQAKITNFLIFLRKKVNNFFLYFIPPFIVFVFYLLSYYPGIMTNDSISQWTQADKFSFSDWHPVFHTLFIWAITRIWHSPAAIAMVQALILSFVFAAAMSQFEKMGIKRNILLLITAFFALNPVNGILSVTIWKDIPYSASVVFLTVLLIKIYYSGGKWLLPIPNRILLIITLIFAALLRHNGIVPAIGSILVVFILYRKLWRNILSIILITIILILAIKGPLYRALEVKPINDYQPLVLSIIQISAIAYYDGDVAEEDKKFLSLLAPWEEWKKGYNKYSSLGITMSKSYSWKNFYKNKNQYIRTWIKIVLRNPGIALKAYLYRTNMVWSITSPPDLNVFCSTNIIMPNSSGFETKSKLPLLKKILDKAQAITHNKNIDWFLLRPALYLYLILISGIFIFRRKGIRPLIVFIPVVFNTLGLALITTSSQTRYYYATILVGPLALLMLLHLRKPIPENVEEENIKMSRPDYFMPAKTVVTEKPKKITVLAATFSGNKGAASMLESIIDNISERIPGVNFDVLSVYPEEDASMNPYRNVKIVSCKPEQIVFSAFPLSLSLIILGRIKPIKKLILKNAILDAFFNSDLVVDAAGISFVDSRGIIMNLYNFICIFIPVVLKKEVVKFSQAMGPFRKLSNRLLAGSVLPGVKAICARGLITEKHLLDMKLSNTYLCADGAFVLPDNNETEQKMAHVFSSDPFFQEKIVGISISSVVYKYCIKAGIDYISIMSRFIDYLAEAKGYNILIIAQSARQNKETLKNNDLVPCRMVFESVNCKEKCRYPDIEMSPREIREYIGKCEMLIASRFHAMISALYKKVPVFLIGWSHKYKEVLDMFDLGSYAADYKNLSFEVLKNEFELFEANLDSIRIKIFKNLPAVKESAMKNIDIIVNLINNANSDRGHSQND